jgi:flagellar protein FlaJ
VKVNKNILIIAFTSTLAALIFLINWIFFVKIPNVFSTIMLVDLFIFAFPLISILYQSYRKKKELEDMFPVFLRDFVESVRGGLTVPHAFKSVSNNDYKGLTPYVKRMAAQMDWGIPIDTVLIKFAKESQSKLIARIISSVIESHRFGGNLADTFEALSNTAVEISRLRSERLLYLQSQIMTGYIIFFVFLGVVIGLEKYLVPSITSAPTLNTVSPQLTQTDITQYYRDLFRDLILIQGLFAGISVGKMAEGSMIAGVKHSFIMMLVGSLVYSVLV